MLLGGLGGGGLGIEVGEGQLVCGGSVEHLGHSGGKVARGEYAGGPILTAAAARISRQIALSRRALGHRPRGPWNGRWAMP
jgi:hypothetical protein